MARLWAILQADTDAKRVSAKAIGCTHAIVSANWTELQPTATGTIDATVMARVTAAYDHCESIGLGVIMAIGLQYPPSWVKSGVEPFKDHLGNQYLNTSTSDGKAVRNWIWTQTGRNYLSDLWTRFAASLGPTRVAKTYGVRLGGGWYGELHYSESVSGSGTLAWQGYGASMQLGTDLASDLTVCPLPGYIPYGTGSTDANDSIWLNWYLNGLVTFGLWQIAQFKALGFTKNLYMLQPGYGVRSNQTRTNAGYKQAAALGEDPVRMIGAIMNLPEAQWYSTWLNTSDGFPGGTVDSDKAAWKKLYEEALKRSKHWGLVGENTGSESNTGMDNIYAGALGSASYAGYPGTPSTGHYYRGMLWLDWNSLNAGGSAATLTHYGAKIAAAG